VQQPRRSRDVREANGLRTGPQSTDSPSLSPQSGSDSRKAFWGPLALPGPPSESPHDEPQFYAGSSQKNQVIFLELVWE
jgi:hypothetical protein